MSAPEPIPAKAATVYRLAAALTFITVALGSMVCATDSSSACPAWPICYSGRVGPSLQSGWLENPVIEFIHRFLSFMCLVTLAWSGWLGRRSRDPRLRVYPWVALGLAVASAVFGMMIILFTLPMALGLIDVGGAVVALGLITVAAQATTRGPAVATLPGAPLTHRLAVGAFGTLLVTHLLGIVVAGRTPDGHSSYTRCIGWPLWQVIDLDGSPALQMLRNGLAGLAVVLIVAAIATGARRATLRVPVALLGAAVTVELGLGVLIRTQGLAQAQTNGIDAGLAVAYSAFAVAILWALAHVAGRAGGAPGARTAPVPRTQRRP